MLAFICATRKEPTPAPSMLSPNPIIAQAPAPERNGRSDHPSDDRTSLLRGACNECSRCHLLHRIRVGGTREPPLDHCAGRRTQPAGDPSTHRRPIHVEPVEDHDQWATDAMVHRPQKCERGGAFDVAVPHVEPDHQPMTLARGRDRDCHVHTSRVPSASIYRQSACFGDALRELRRVSCGCFSVTPCHTDLVNAARGRLAPRSGSKPV